MKTVKIELTVEQLQELHIILGERLVLLDNDLKHKKPEIQRIVQRQLDRAMPIYSTVQSMVVKHHSSI